ncbi:hypothetical protein [Mesorhizobium sp. CO1-1-8]|uniref:hypothetical protein n=1 Tax=Mesorhizobium sp. CO1-1-8 TaxID=2876631 RepID=UPI001CD1312E|nr:hypothetical protein [Mesorhizobium sp. CO1-1-8]MBZ9774073.1 hypothetical protein [Mesorhizobium sp. CO1-1-8]
MVETHMQVALAVIETSFRLRHHSLAGTDSFRRDMDHSRRAIEASRELLKRLRQRHRDDMGRGWEDPDPTPASVSAFDADILRSAFRALVRDMSVPECQWRDLAESLVREYVGCEQIEIGLLDWITQR